MLLSRERAKHRLHPGKKASCYRLNHDNCELFICTWSRGYVLSYHSDPLLSLGRRTSEDPEVVQVITKDLIRKIRSVFLGRHSCMYSPLPPLSGLQPRHLAGGVCCIYPGCLPLPTPPECRLYLARKSSRGSRYICDSLSFSVVGGTHMYVVDMHALYN